MAQGVRVKPLERKVLRDTVYETLLDMLMSGVLAPGAPLSIDGLAGELQVSPTPVREALVHLEGTGLVSRAPLRGYRVASPLTPEQIAQLFDARLIIEIGALELAFKDPKLANGLAAAHARHEATAQAILDVLPGKAAVNAYRAYMDADWGFHQTFFSCARNDYLLATVGSLPAHLHRLRQSLSRGVSDSVQAVDEHAAVLRAVQEGDLELAKQALRDHLTSVKDRSRHYETQAAS